MTTTPTNWKLNIVHLRAVCWLLALIGGAAAVEAVVVTGQNDPAIDVPEVQKAVDAGGLVELDGTFDFGDQRVLIGKEGNDVTIKGLDGHLIRNGEVTFTNAAALYSPGEPLAAVDVTLDGLRIDGAATGAVYFDHGGRVTVTGCTITNVRPGPFLGGALCERRMTDDPCVSAGLVFDTRFTQTDPAGFESISILGNTVDLNAGRVATYAAVIQVGIEIGRIEAPIEIRGNTVRNANQSGVQTVATHQLTLADNVVEPGLPQRFEYGSGDAILVIGALHEEGGQHAVTGNRITVRSPHASGILLARDDDTGHGIRGATIADNAITLRDGAGGIVLASGTNGATVRGNRVGGSPRWVSLGVYGSEAPSTGNLLEANDLSGADPKLADVYFGDGSSDNRFSGMAGKVVDRGRGNDLDVKTRNWSLIPASHDSLRVESGKAAIRLGTHDDRGDYATLRKTGVGRFAISQVSSVKGAMIDLTPRPQPDEQAVLRLFRETNTTGRVITHFYRGDGTSAVSAQIGSNGQHSYFQNHGGNFGIRTNRPRYPLHVEGTVWAKELKLEGDQVLGADFVFEDDYALRPLAEVERFVTENRHLPDVPPARAMAEDGVEVGELQIKLLKKVEELTLYAIALDKQNRALEERLARLEEVAR